MALPKIGVEAVVENIDGYKKAMKSMNDSNDAATASVQATAKKFDVLGTAAKAVGNTLQTAFGNIIAGVVLKTLDFIGSAIENVISKIGDLAKNIFDAGVEFSGTMANISSVTKITGKDLSQLSKDLIEVGADSAAGPQAVAAAYYDVASGVLDASKRMDVLKASIALSEAGQANLQASTQGVISVMNAYGDAAGGATKIADVFTQTVATGVGTMDQFVGAMTPLAGIAAAQKISFTELGGAISYMTAKGIPAEQAATAIKAAMVQLSRQTPQVTRALRAMGEKSIASSIANNGLAKTLQLLEAGAKKTGQNFTTMLGSVEALQAATALGTDDFQKYFDTFVDGVDGATAAARELQRADVSFQLKIMQARFQAVGLSISQAVLPAFNKFLTAVNKGLQKIDWKKIGAGLDKMGEILGNVAGKIIDNIGKALEGVDWEKVSSDIGLAAANIGQFFANIDWQSVIAGIANFVRSIPAAIQSVVAFFQNLIAQVNTMAGVWSTAWTNISTFVSGVWNNLAGGAKMLADGLGVIWNQAFGPNGTISTAVSTAFASVQTFVSTAQTNLSGGFQMLIDGLGAVWDQAFGPTGSVSTAVGSALDSAGMFISIAITNIQAGFQGIVDGVSGIWDYYFGADGQIAQAVSNAWNSVNQFISDNIGPVSDAVTQITNAVSDVWNALFGPSGSVAANVLAAIQSVIDGVNGFVAGVRAAFAAIASAIVTALQPALALINSLLSGISAITSFVSGQGGGGSAPGGAAGGVLQEGLNVVGERGAEVIYKEGNRASVVSHKKSKDFIKGLDRITPLPKGMNPLDDISNPSKGAPVPNIPGIYTSTVTLPPSRGPILTKRQKLMHQIFRRYGLDPRMLPPELAQQFGFAPHAMPVTAGGDTMTNTTNNNATHNENTIILNGVRNGENAVERLAMLKAVGRVP